MIALGTTLRCNLPPRHLWVVLSDPQQTGDDLLLVSLTSLREGCVDDLADETSSALRQWALKR